MNLENGNDLNARGTEHSGIEYLSGSQIQDAM
jgi:hypothetical protein